MFPVKSVICTSNDGSPVHKSNVFTTRLLWIRLRKMPNMSKLQRNVARAPGWRPKKKKKKHTTIWLIRISSTKSSARQNIFTFLRAALPNEFPLIGGGLCPPSDEAAVALLRGPSHREPAEARAPFYQVPFVPFALVPLHDSTSTSIGFNRDHVNPPKPLLTMACHRARAPCGRSPTSTPA